MITRAIIGSDKNAGKTTVLNFIYQQCLEKRICLTSIGINGEAQDNFHGHVKPEITIYKGDYFVTAKRWLENHLAKYRIEKIFDLGGSEFVFARALIDFEIVLEGPNTSEGIITLKNQVRSHLVDGVLLIDGSIDRQFLGQPWICDEFYFALYLPKNKMGRERALQLLNPMKFTMCDEKSRELIKKNNIQGTKSLLISADNNSIAYTGSDIPSLDKILVKNIQTLKGKKLLYINGALTGRLYDSLSKANGLEVILDNFTQYQNTKTTDYKWGKGNLKISLYHKMNIKRIFLKCQGDENISESNSNNCDIIVNNLFRESIDEIRI